MNETKGNLNIIDKSFKDFFIKYSKTINKNYNRTGALFQQKFKKKEINKSDYLIRLIPYIHNNPVRAKLCEKPEEWKFSSYQYIIKNKFNNQVISELMDLFGDIDTFKQIHIQYSSYQNERNFLFKE